MAKTVRSLSHKLPGLISPILIAMYVTNSPKTFTNSYLG
jgi:hypothetical protein